MTEIITETVYFEGIGAVNSRMALELAKKRADTLGIRDVVVASYTGETGALASEIFRGYNLIVVAGMVGFMEPNQDRMKAEHKKTIEDSGGKIIRACHSFGALGRAVNKKFNTIQVDEIIAHVLRLFGAGVKVACECACMAADAGLISTDREVVSLGGNGGGADTAVILLPCNTHRFFDMRIREIVCKPRSWERLR
ncbi:hypothetical protein A3K78_09165 [Candidatus Bathyarchaeota archaeon RBG_13_52_12]|nr:MAG: hypothetical protein A3K78_09165 [Candidatus Bathyarchaeota archaeon RBG_13_52_12]